MVKRPVWGPATDGANITSMSHFCPGVTPTEQLSVSEKSPVIETRRHRHIPEIAHLYVRCGARYTHILIGERNESSIHQWHSSTQSRRYLH